MPRKRGTATKASVTAKERKFEALHRRAEEKRRRRAEAEHEGRREAGGDAPAGEDAAGQG